MTRPAAATQGVAAKAPWPERSIRHMPILAHRPDDAEGQGSPCGAVAVHAPLGVTGSQQGRVHLMPYYEHECTECGKKFEALQSFEEHDRHQQHEVHQPLKCPKCGSKKVEQLI